MALATTTTFLFTSLLGAPEADRVTSIPGFDANFTFDVYSGYLQVAGPVPASCESGGKRRCFTVGSSCLSPLTH